MTKFLAITRAIIGWAVSLHIWTLGAHVRQSAKTVTLAAARHDDAKSIAAEAINQRALANSTERQAKTTHAALVAAAQTEASLLRRGALLA